MHLKKRGILVGILLVVLIMAIACKTQTEEATKTTEEKPQKTLSDLQTIACDAADKAGTCNSRLVDIGIVSPEQCCEILQKCC